ncbi:sulfotransferase domain-containing protein, partial [Campylobacter sp. RM13119]|uniref:sulfotransferase domain-containing protein n=1 Tax=Campylobacter californiensis TaxID=1032243 RepID=UPI0014748FD4
IKRKKTIYLHIGWPKTGTSAIQQFLVRNFDVLKNKYNLFYPDYGRWIDGSHHNIAFSLMENPYCKMKLESEQYQYLKELKDLMLNSNCDNILLSSECFKLYDSKVFQDLFCGLFNIKIICYLRDHDQYIESMYGQNVRDPFFKEKQTFKDFLKSFKERLFYSRTLMQWEKLTDKNNFIIRHYSIEKFVNKNIIDDFLTALNIRPNKLDFQYGNSIVNESYTKNILEYKRLLNIIVDKQSKELIQILQKYSKTYPEQKINFLTTNEKNEFNTLFLEDNKAIENRYKNSNFTPSQRCLDIAKNDSYGGISNESIKNITNFIFTNNIELFKLIQNDCLAYSGLKDERIEKLLHSFMDKVL